MSTQQPPTPHQPTAQQGHGNNQPVQNPRLGSNRSPPYHQPIPTVVWDLRRHVANDLQRWAGQSLTPFLRSRFPVLDPLGGRVHANYDFDCDVDGAVRWSEHIDAFDNNPDLMDELVLYLTCEQHADQNLAMVAQDRQLVTILLYRHYQRHGGLVLPPVAAARQAVDRHVEAVQSARQRGLQPPRVVFPNWTFGGSAATAAVAGQVGVNVAATAFGPLVSMPTHCMSATAQTGTSSRSLLQGSSSMARRSGNSPLTTIQGQRLAPLLVQGGCKLTGPSNSNDSHDNNRRDAGEGGEDSPSSRKSSLFLGGSKRI